MIILELKRYGDFDILQTHSVWINLNISSFDVATLEDFRNDRDPSNAIEQLEAAGSEKSIPNKLKLEAICD